MEKIADGFKGERAIILPDHIRAIEATNVITKQLFVTHIGYYPHAKYHFRERESGAKQYILILCEEGKGWVICHGVRYSLSRNQVFIIPKNEAHIYGADEDDPWSIYWIHFLGDHVGLFSAIIGKVIDTRDSYNSRNRDRFLLFQEIFQNLEMGYNHENLEYASICLMHFLATIKYLSQFREIKSIKELDTVQKSILYMKEHLEEKISLKEIAQYVGYSPSHFGNIFFKETSSSPISYYSQA